MTTETILSGDVGGTNCRLALLDPDGNVVAERVYPSANYGGLEDIVADFLTTGGYRPAAACFGMPCPVRKGQCDVTNLPWRVDAAQVAAVTDIGAVRLLNDVEANAYGIRTLGAEDIVTLNAGIPIRGGVVAVISPGTGLGEAALVEVSGHSHAIATEGGHSDFGPTDETEWGLAQHVRAEIGRASYEQILSGPGLVRIFEFLRRAHTAEPAEDVLEAMRSGDPAAAIGNAGLTGRCPVARRALDLFVAILGSEAGNVALKFLATGGVYLGGGIVPRIIERLKEPIFLERFSDKDKMRPLLESVPVHAIINDKTALRGAGWFALNRIVG